MTALAWIFMFVEGCAVEAAQGMTVGREMRRRPIQNNADAVFVAAVDKIHKILGGAVAAGNGKIAGNLVSP